MSKKNLSLCAVFIMGAIWLAAFGASCAVAAGSFTGATPPSAGRYQIGAPNCAQNGTCSIIVCDGTDCYREPNVGNTHWGFDVAPIFAGGAMVVEVMNGNEGTFNCYRSIWFRNPTGGLENEGTYIFTEVCPPAPPVDSFGAWKKLP